MAATFRGSDGYDATSGDGLGGLVTLSATTAGAQVGDLLVAFIGRYVGSNTPGVTPPAGWTQLQYASGTSVYDYSGWSFYRFMVAGDTTFTWSGLYSYRHGVLLAYANAAAIDNSGVVSGGGTSRTTPIISASVANCVAVHAYGLMADSTFPIATISTPTGTTSRAYKATQPPIAIRAVDEVRSASGNTVGRLASWPLAAASVAHVVLIAPGIGKTGSAASGRSASGVSVYIASTSRVGSGARGSSASGVKVLIPANYKIKAGAVSAGLVATGAKTQTRTKAGSASAGAAALGTREHTRVQSGSAAWGAAATGLYETDKHRTGSTELGLVAVGQRTVTLNRDGTAELGTSAVSTHIRESVKTGSCAAGLEASGERSLVITRSGEAVTQPLGQGERFVDYDRYGSAEAGSAGSGVRERDVTVVGSAAIGADGTATYVVKNLIRSGTGTAGGSAQVEFQTEYVRTGTSAAGATIIASHLVQLPPTQTTAGSIRAQLRRAGVETPIFRDAPDGEANFPFIVIKEAQAEVREARFNSYDDPQGHMAEDVRIEIWQAWRNASGQVAESYTLPDQVTKALVGSRLPSSVTQVTGVRVRSRTRKLEEEKNRVIETLIIEVHRLLAGV